MEVTLDSRETDLSRTLASLSIPHVCAPLDVGDVLVRSGRIELLLERKSLADLIASVSDGRYAEQKARLVAWSAIRAGESHAAMRRVAYVLEIPPGWRFGLDLNVVPSGVAKRTRGSPNFLPDPTDPTETVRTGSRHDRTVASCMIHTLVRDGIPVFRVGDMSETAELIGALARRGDSMAPTTAAMTYPKPTCSAAIRRKDNLGGSVDCLVRQLCQVPGISSVRAAAIVRAAGAVSIVGLVRWLGDDAVAATSALEGVPGVGDHLARNLVSALYGG